MGELLERVLGGMSPGHPATPSRALVLSELEERILLSASPVMVVAPEMAEGVFADSAPAETATIDAQDNAKGMTSQHPDRFQRSH